MQPAQDGKSQGSQLTAGAAAGASPPMGSEMAQTQQTAPRRHAMTVSYAPNTRPSSPGAPNAAGLAGNATAEPTAGRRRGLSLSNAFRPRSGSDDQPALAPMGRRSSLASISTTRPRNNQQVADLMDAIDPEVSAMNTLTDVQNSLFVPNFRAIFDRSPAPRIPGQPPRDAEELVPDNDFRLASQPARTLPVRGPLQEVRNAPQPTTVARPLPPGAAARYERDAAGRPVRPTTSVISEVPDEETEDAAPPAAKEKSSPSLDSKSTELKGEKDTTIQGDYLLLPKDLINWDEWTDEEKKELDEYVRHLRYSRKERFRRGFKGFLHYIRTPLGAFIFIYASLLTFWGAAWILFIIGWISVGDRQDYFVEICDQILTALFCVVGIGLFPFRLWDTYHMIFIVKYHRKVLRLRKERGYPDLSDENEIPIEENHNESAGFTPVSDRKMNPDGSIVSKQLADGTVICTTSADLEAAHQLHHGVLTDKEYGSFLHHQHRFGKSHTFYRPHESVTHRAYPLDLMITVIALLDFHSCFQIALGSLTWSVSYHHNWKHKVTAVVLSISITINITAGIVIAVGNSRTRKKEIIERLFRQAITEEALKRAERHPDKHPLPLARSDSGHAVLLPKPVPTSRHSRTKSSERTSAPSRTSTEVSKSSAHSAAEPEALGGRRTDSKKSRN